mmetsp:Transcript_35653/g.79302  ORF Transcript_35653/g.79302 Transcript_35653/m.79302 type:complete len:213 (+) Transcript_35653:710-1348(+)
MRHRFLSLMAASTSSLTPHTAGLTGTWSSTGTSGAAPRTRSTVLRTLLLTSSFSMSGFMLMPCFPALRAAQATMSSLKKRLSTCGVKVFLATMACAAFMIATTKTPSTPKGVKKVDRLRVRRKGTLSLRSSWPLSLYMGMKSCWKTRPVSLANRILDGWRPPTMSMWHSRPDSAICMQNCFLKTQRWLLPGSVLNMNWLNTLSLTILSQISV